MGVFSFENETSTAVPPSRLFNAFVIDGDNLFVKVAPQAIKSVEIVEGDGGAGSIKKITFHGGQKANYVKQKIESIDKDNLAYNYSIIEGDILTNRVEKISHENKIVASADGGSILKTKSTFYTVDEAEISEETIKAGRAKGTAMFKAIEAYLLANPDAYN